MKTIFEQFDNSNVMSEMTLGRFLNERINLMASLRTFGDAEIFDKLRSNKTNRAHLKNIYLYLKCKAGKLDLFQYPELVPDCVLDLLDQFAEGESYELCKSVKAEVEKMGYTFDYGLDAQPFNLIKIR